MKGNVRESRRLDPLLPSETEPIDHQLRDLRVVEDGTDMLPSRKQIDYYYVVVVVFPRWMIVAYHSSWWLVRESEWVREKRKFA